MRIRLLSGVILMSTLVSLAGCHVQVDKGKNGEEKNVKVDTPLGSVHVRSDQTAAADLGLPAYPGSQIAPDKQGDKSADVHLGFGRWQMRVKVVTYTTPDPQDKVLAFYRDALGRFGDVVECQGQEAVGHPTVTAEGLGCKEEHHGKVHVSGVSDDTGLSLRAGSRRHQHIMAIKSSGSGTKYSLVELQLPDGDEEGASRTSD